MAEVRVREEVVKKHNRAQRRKTAVEEAIAAAKRRAYRNGIDEGERRSLLKHTQFLHPKDGGVDFPLPDGRPYIRIADYPNRPLTAPPADDELVRAELFDSINVHDFRAVPRVCHLPNGTIVRWYTWELMN